MWSPVNLGSLTNNVDGHCCIDMFNAYVGLEMAMSLVKMNSIKEYWREENFSGHPDFYAP